MSQINSECLFFDDTDDETKVNSLLYGFLIDAALVIQASTPTIQKYQRSYMPRDQGCDAVGKAGISALVKCTSAIRQLAYADVPDSLDEYLQIGEKTSRDCLMHFCNGNKYGFPGMIDNIDCTKWSWAQCPQAYRAQFSRGDSGSEPFILLKAVASQYLWIWHTLFGVAEWAVLMKSISQPGSNDVKRIRYKQAHEAAGKDMERAFGVLKKK
ncbi:ALP1-like protein isoform X1 [Tanacetum coccineum]